MGTIILGFEISIGMNRRSEITRRDLLRSIAMGFATGPRNWRISSSTSPVEFVDVAARAGIAFRHDNAASSQKYLIQTMGAGCSWIDDDQDGLVDLYLVNSGSGGGRLRQ